MYRASVLCYFPDFVNQEDAAQSAEKARVVQEKDMESLCSPVPPGQRLSVLTIRSPHIRMLTCEGDSKSLYQIDGLTLHGIYQAACKEPTAVGQDSVGYEGPMSPLPTGAL